MLLARLVRAELDVWLGMRLGGEIGSGFLDCFSCREMHTFLNFIRVLLLFAEIFYRHFVFMRFL